MEGKTYLLEYLKMEMERRQFKLTEEEIREIIKKIDFNDLRYKIVV